MTLFEKYPGLKSLVTMPEKKKRGRPRLWTKAEAAARKRECYRAAHPKKQKREPRPKAKPEPKRPAYLIRYNGSWVSLLWYRKHVQAQTKARAIAG